MTDTPAPGSDVVPSTLGERMRFAQALSDARLLPAPYRRSPSDVLLAVEYAAALGIAPVTALNSVHVIEGRPSMSAELMRALVLRAGHRFRVVESTSERCVVEVSRREYADEVSRFAWTLDDARRAGLVPGKPSSNWERYPTAMLLARATSAACRAVFPDVLAGVSYVPEELSAGADVDVILGTVVEPDVDADVVEPPDVVDAVVVAESTGEVLEAQEPRQDATGEDPGAEEVGGIPPPGRGRRTPSASAYSSVRRALGTDRPGDTRGPTDAQLRAVNARLREAGCRDETHRGWAVAALLDRPGYVESLRSLDRREVSALLDLDRAALEAALEATVDLPHPDDDVDDAAVDAVVVDEVDEVEGPPARPRLSSDEATS